MITTVYGVRCTASQGPNGTRELTDRRRHTQFDTESQETPLLLDTQLTACPDQGVFGGRYGQAVRGDGRFGWGGGFEGQGVVSGLMSEQSRFHQYRFDLSVIVWWHIEI